MNKIKFLEGKKTIDKTIDKIKMLYYIVYYITKKQRENK